MFSGLVALQSWTSFLLPGSQALFLTSTTRVCVFFINQFNRVDGLAYKVDQLWFCGLMSDERRDVVQRNCSIR